MPIRVEYDLPARNVLESENVFMMGVERAEAQEIRPLEILILNLMPVKEDYETQLLRALSNTPLQVELTYLFADSHESKNTPKTHLKRFYTKFSEIEEKHYDGMILTGAPLEHLAYEEVDFWPELCHIMDWAKTHVTSTLYICWGALAGLYYHFGIDKTMREDKISGVFTHRLLDRCDPLVRGFDDLFKAPHSRYAGVTEEDIYKCPDLKLLCVSEEAGVYLLRSRDGRHVFLLGHPEYDRMSLDQEYKRDLLRGENPVVPMHYYENDDPRRTPLLSWRCHANTLYTNWLNYHVYQITPYTWE